MLGILLMWLHGIIYALFILFLLFSPSLSLHIYYWSVFKFTNIIFGFVEYAVKSIQWVSNSWYYTLPL